nr:molybdopterin-guanine dinucleotide biosynthesis protein MobB [Campylobacter sp.]
MKRLVVGFSGASGSGKTTLVLKIANELILRGFKVCIIKHDPANKAKFDEGKDSTKYFQTGANVALIGPKKTALFLNKGFFGGIDRISSKEHFEKNEK